MIPKELYLPNHLNPMMPVFFCIRNSLQSGSIKKANKNSKPDIFEIVNAHGTEAQKFMFSCLVQSIDLKEIKQKGGQTVGKVNLFNQALSQFSTREAFMYYFADVLINLVKSPLQYVQSIIKYLKPTIVIQIIMALSLYLSENANISKDGYNLLKNKINQYHQSKKSPPQSFPPKILQELLFQIGKNPQLQCDLEQSYQYLLETNVPEKAQELKYYHFINKNNRIFTYEPPQITKPAQIIKKADILRDLGPYCTFNIQSLKTVLQQFGPLTEQDVFQCLMIMAQENTVQQDSLDRFMTDLMVANKKINKAEQWKKFYSNNDLTEKKMQAGWNIDVFLTYAVQNVQNLKWTSVLGYFDRLNLEFKTDNVFVNMFKFFQKAKKQGPKYKTPQVLFFKKWNHPRSQLTFLLNVFKCDQPDIFAINEINNKKIIKVVADGLKNQSPALQQFQLWAYPDLVQLLIQLSDYDFMATKSLFQIPLTKCPEILLQTLSQIHFNKGDAMLNELYSQLFPVYISNHTSHIKLLENLWQSNEDLVISSICELYKVDNKKQSSSSLNLSKVLDITQNIRQGLIPLSNWNDYHFSVALGVLAGKRQFLHFEQWIKQRLKNVGSHFLAAILQYVQENFLKQTRQNVSKYGANSQSIHQSIDIQLQKAQLSRQLLAFIYQSALQFPSSKFTIRTVQMLKKQYKQICQHFPQMTDSQVVDQIEILAEKNFCKIYKQEITLEQAIQMMHNLKNSSRQEQKQLYASMITYLFTQLRFHSNYPEKQLMTTANFFALIINAKFIEKKLFNVFIMVLSEDLRFNDRRYDFAVTVIDKIKDRLVEEPAFVEQLLENQSMMIKNPEIIKALLDKFKPPLDISPQKLAALKTAIDVKFAPPPPQEPEKVIVPEKDNQITDSDVDLLEIQQKIQKSVKNSQNVGKLTLACNTLSAVSINDKLIELKKWLDSKQIIRWFSYHLVFKRITNCNQASMFELYSNLLSELPVVVKPVMNISYKVLQRWFDLQGKSINDKKLKAFKNIGTWLGRMTIGKYQPLLINKLNIKEILVKSFLQKNRLQVNLEVITKILENIIYSKQIFSLKNPWLAPILGIFKQLNGKTNDTQIKPQIMRFFKNTSISESQIAETNYLSSSMDKGSLTIAQLPDYVEICDEQLKVYIDKGVDLRKIIAQAVDAAIQQIVPPVISRSVTIALVTTKQLALKDFVLEPDDQKLLKGTHCIVQNLSGSLALVTCRQPLKMSLTNFLKKKLQQYAFLTQPDKEKIVFAASRDNIDLGCALIKRAVIEKALEQIDKDPHIIEQLQKRREAREKGEVFQNKSYYAEIAEYMPESLRPKAGGISDEQFRIYQDFQKDKRLQPSSLIDKKSEVLTNKQKLQKLITMVQDIQPIQNIKDFIQKNEFSLYTEFAEKVNLMLFSKKKNSKYYVSLLKLVKNNIKPQTMLVFFNENAPENINNYSDITSELYASGYFPPQVATQVTSKKPKINTYEDKQYQQMARGLLQEWTNCDKQIEEYLSMLSDRFTKGDDEQIKKFFYFTISYAVEQSLNSKGETSDVLNYKYIDEESKLIVVSLKIVSNNRSVYLDHISEAIIMVIHKYHELETDTFNQRPFFRLILNIIYDISRKNYKFDENIILTVYTAFSTLLHRLEPNNYPGFSFAWLELISSKYFMPAILQNYQYWDLYHELLLDLLKFAKNKLTNEVLGSNELFKTFYKGILRLSTILLHDFPDFSSEFSFTLSNQIPDRFVQLRNVILSAFPQSQWFPEPQNIPNKDLDAIKYMNQLPKYYKTKLDKSFEIFGIHKSEEKRLALKKKLQDQSSQGINTFVLNAGLSIYEASNKIEDAQKQVRQLFVWILTFTNPSTRQKVIRGILNMIRFPNLLTLFFIRLSDTVLYQNNDASLQQAFVKSIIERMVVEKPHPWGIIFVVDEMKINKKKLNHLNLKEINEL